MAAYEIRLSRLYILQARYKIEPTFQVALASFLIYDGVAIRAVYDGEFCAAAGDRFKGDRNEGHIAVVIPLPGKGEFSSWLKRCVVAAQVPVPFGPGKMVGTIQPWVNFCFRRPP